jgi:hypothetical protein
MELYYSSQMPSPITHIKQQVSYNHPFPKKKRIQIKTILISKTI